MSSASKCQTSPSSSVSFSVFQTYSAQTKLCVQKLIPWVITTNVYMEYVGKLWGRGPSHWPVIASHPKILNPQKHRCSEPQNFAQIAKTCKPSIIRLVASNLLYKNQFLWSECHLPNSSSFCSLTSST